MEEISQNVPTVHLHHCPGSQHCTIAFCCSWTSIGLRMNSFIFQICCNKIYNFHNLKKSKFIKIRPISQPKTIRGERSIDVVYIKCHYVTLLKLKKYGLFKVMLLINNDILGISLEFRCHCLLIWSLLEKLKNFRTPKIFYIHIPISLWCSLIS